MTNFKPGEGVINKHTNEILQFYFMDEFAPTECYGKYDQYIGNITKLSLWQPQVGEWCWFWNDERDIPRLRQFISAENEFNRPTVYITRPDPATAMSRVYYGIESYKYCEPFIGQLPTILKDT